MQMTADTSLGPILISVTFFLSSCRVFRSLQHIHAINILKKYEILQKPRTYGPNDVLFGPVFTITAHYLSLSVA